MDHAATAQQSFLLAPIFSALILLLIAVAYQYRWTRYGKGIAHLASNWRPIAFHTGSAILWIAIGSRLATLHHESLTAHMIDHILLSSVSAPLLLLGEPFLIFSRKIRSTRVTASHGEIPASTALNSEQSITASPPHSALQRITQSITRPVFCWSASVAVLIFWHLPRIFESSMQRPPLHLLEQFTFFATGILFWWPVIEPWPSQPKTYRWMIPLYLLLATLPCDVLSAFLVFCDRVVYPSYQSLHASLPRGHAHFFSSALQDQQCAGALMWVCVTFLYLTPGVLITLRELQTHPRHPHEQFHHTS
jgi:putative membrane protein